jgi:hypothetical protein
LTKAIFLARLTITPLLERVSAHTAAEARATKMRNTPGPTEWLARYSSAS